MFSTLVRQDPSDVMPVSVGILPDAQGTLGRPPGSSLPAALGRQYTDWAVRPNFSLILPPSPGKAQSQSAAWPHGRTTEAAGGFNT